MSDKLAALLGAMDTDPDVATRFRDALPENAPLTPDMFLAAARAAGFTLAAEDLPPRSAPLGDAMLEEVSGGMDSFYNLERWRKVWKR